MNFKKVEQILTSSDPLPSQSDEYYLTAFTRSVDNEYDLIHKGRTLPVAVNPRSGWQSRAINKNLLTAPYWTNPKNQVRLPESRIEEAYTLSEARAEYVLLDGKDVLESLGGGSVRQVHHLCLHSAYEDTSLRGEPIFTQSILKPSNTPDIKCADYVFFSESSLVVANLLGLPRLSRIEGEDGRGSALPYGEDASPPERIKRYFNKDLGIPEGMEDENIKRVLTDWMALNDENWDEFMAGTWIPFPAGNERPKKVFLPMHSSGSCHLLLCADIILNSKYAAVQWPLRES